MTVVRDRTAHASMLARVTGPALWWMVLAVVVSLVVLAAASVTMLERGPVPPYVRGDVPRVASVEPRAPDVLHLAGSGSNVPLTRALAEAFSSRRGHGVVVHESIGSRGGIRAVYDGAIDLGLVSRALRPEEAEGMVVQLYARSAVLVAVHASVPDGGITRNQLLDLYRGVQTVWSDGARVVVLQRERGDSSHRAVGEVVDGFAQANEAAYREGRYRVVYRDPDMREALATTRGSVGLYGVGEIPRDVPLRALRVDGVAPSAETLADGRYPFSKELAFVSRGPLRGIARDFVAFVLSAEGQQIIRERGYMPIDGGAQP